MKRWVSFSGLWIVLLASLLALGCPQAPDGAPPDQGNDDTTGDNTAGVKLVVFQDPDSTFSTSDVYDVDNQIVRFDSETLAIIWAETDTAYQAGIWSVDGNLLTDNKFFQVRFGNVDGARRAFFTEVNPPTICDISATATRLSISSTQVTVPQ